MSVLKFKNPNYTEGGAEEKWITLPTGGGIGDAPEDGKQYARQDGEWSEVAVPDVSSFVTTSELQTGLNDKQDTIEDLQSIREGAALGATALRDARIPVVDQTESTVQIQPNVYNKWGEVASLTITLAAPDDATLVNEYMVEFVSGDTATTLTLPDGLSFVGGETPTIEANKTYQLSILNNSVVIVGFSTVN